MAENTEDKGVVYYFNRQTEKSYWQPKPANGFVTVAISPEFAQMKRDFSMGTQTVPVGGRVREHAHPDHEEVLHFISGRGKAIIDGKEYVLEPGVTVFLGTHNSHTFINDGEEDLHWAWFMQPSGLEYFFRDIGCPRKEGDPTPEPFERPENIEQIEGTDKGVFAYTKNT
ncbi:cupin domain-containing protein [Acinetobacter baumannii]|nr:cupin domain-containing protein [Acinetobacter baumannii]